MYLLISICLFICQIGVSQDASLYGRILDKNQLTPLQSAQIVLFKEGRYLYKCKSDHAGKFHFSSLHEGNYTLWVIKKGYCKYQLIDIHLQSSNGIQYDIEMIGSVGNGKDDEITAFYQGPYIAEKHRFIRLRKEEERLNIFELYGQYIEISQKETIELDFDRRATHYYTELDREQQKLGKSPN